MTSKRIHEAGTISVDSTTSALRVCLITEGSGSSANYPREFFNQTNADRLAESLSFPAHPMDLEHPEFRDPLSAIATIGDTVTIEEHEGKLSFWSTYHPATSKPETAAYLAEFGPRLGLSIYSDSDGHDDPTTGKWIAESLVENDPYRSVDLVVAAGRGGKIERVAEALGLLPNKTSAHVEEEEVTHMDKDIEERFNALDATVSKLSEALEGKAKAELQASADEEAVTKAVESRLANYDKVKEAVDAAQLTESQAKSLMARAAKGEALDTLQPDIDNAKAVVAEALKSAGVTPSERKTVAEHLGADDKGGDFNISIPGFGKVA